MRGIFGGAVLIGALAFVQPAASQSGQTVAEAGLLYAGPTTELVTSDTVGDARSGALPAVAGATSTPRVVQPASGRETGFMLASIDARPFARPETAEATGRPSAQSPAQSASQSASQSSEIGTVSRYALRVLEVVNEYRQRNGLAPLRIAEDLGSIAQSHSVKMAERRRISHDGFRERFDRTTSRICVENVGMNFPHPEAQVDGWRASPGHDRNLLEPRVTRVGIANNRNFVTFFACS